MLSKLEPLKMIQRQYIAEYNMLKFDNKPEHSYTSFRGLANARVKHMSETFGMEFEMQGRGRCVSFVFLFS